MNFNACIKELAVLAEKINRLDNEMRASRFAEKKGWIERESRERLRKMEKEYDKIRKQADAVWNRLETKYADRFRSYLSGMEERLLRLQQKSTGDQIPASTPQGEFNSNIIGELADVFRSLLRHEKPRHDPYWALAVGNRLIPGDAGTPAGPDPAANA